MRHQLEHARKEATLENTRRHLALVKRKHEEVSEALEIAAVLRLPTGQANERVLKVRRTFSHWSANNAAKKMGEFLDAAAGRAADDAEGAKLQRRVAAKLTDRYQPPAPSGAPCYGPCCRHAVTAVLPSDRAVREWRGYAKEELGVEHQALKGKIVTAAVPIGMAVANRIWDLRGVKQTTGVTKGVRHGGLHNNGLVGNIHVLLYEGDDAYEVLAEKGKRFFDGLNDIATKGVTLK
eukprot:jgi/Tetstr1/462938/TSEL_007886.t1